MAWFSGKVSLGGFPDIAGAVNKFSESVKNIEKNFDSALGFEEKSDGSSHEASGLWSSPVMAFMGNKSEEGHKQSSRRSESSQDEIEQEEEVKGDVSLQTHVVQTTVEGDKEIVKSTEDTDNPEAIEGRDDSIPDSRKTEDAIPASVEPSEPKENSDVGNSENSDSTEAKPKELPIVGPSENTVLSEANFENERVDKTEGAIDVQSPAQESESFDDQVTEKDKSMGKGSPVLDEAFINSQPGDVTEASSLRPSTDESESADELPEQSAFSLDETASVVSESISLEKDTNTKKVEDDHQNNDRLSDVSDKRQPTAQMSLSDASVSMLELEKVKTEMKMMESALQGAARQAQAKADEIAKLMNENEQLKGVIENLKRKSSEAEIESLREEYHQRVSTLERKVYALTKERDTLRREQSKRSDAATLLKEKDEIITQVMAEGEELSKKQAVQESTIRKLRAQIRELEEEKKGLTTKLQAEENKVESIKRDKAATEKLLQETIEKHQVELASQKEYYTNALMAAKEAEALAEARANSEARTELESRLREAEEREAMLVQTLEELRQTLSQTEQQAVSREDMLRRDIEDLQKRYQASERRCEELITQVPESTRPLLRQIEAMQETTARRAEAWAAVERSLNSRLQEAEANAAAAEERERLINERLSQTLSRINVLEAQISCLRAEQTQLSKSLEKERQRAAENRQEYLAAKEEADTQEGRAKQLEEEIRELRRKHKQELQDALVHRELLQQEIEREKAARLDLERASHVNPTSVSDQAPIARHNSTFENGTLSRKLSSASSLGSMEESYFLQASLGSSDSFSERRNTGEAVVSPFYMKSMTPNAFEAALRQKEGELQSYMSRLASMESIRDSLAEELVKMTAQCERLKVEAAMLPGIRAELEALRRRHSAALELMGERDEELEELRNDIVDLKEMYREQVNLLVNKIQIMSSQTDSSS